MRRDTWLALAVLLAVLAAMAAKSLLVSVPEVREHPAIGQFDTQRAQARLARVLGDQRPHPADSAANDAVRDRLIAELRSMGFSPIVRDQTACNAFRTAKLVACARVRNVIATAGPPTGKALLLSAHYDSTAVGPGAGDDGVGVATLLEVASLMKDEPLKRPIIFLFDEGEELGLLGARAFLSDPLSRNVDSLLNFEARGVTGPVTMFETSRPNGAAVAAFGSAVDRPFASSLMTDVYRLMPNDTDVSTFKERGWLTLNFAMTGNETRYHSPGDNLAALDGGSLQHMGDQALALSRELAAGVPQTGGQRIFIDILGHALLQMPLLLGIALYAVLLACFALLAWRRGALIRALATVIGAILLAGAAGWLASTLMGAIRPGTYWRAHPELTYVAVYAVALFGVLVVLRTLGGPVDRGRMRAGYWLVFLLLGAALAIAAPGAIVYFLFPPLAVLLGIVLARWDPRAETVGAIAALLILFVTWGEMLALLEVLFSPGPVWIVAPFGAIVMLPALIEAGPLFARASRTMVLACSAALAAAAWLTVGLAPAYSQDRQQLFTVEHVTALPSGKSAWSVLNDGAPLPAAYRGVAEWRRGKLPYSERLRWIADAPPIPGSRAPSIEPLEIVRNGTERTLRLRLHANGSERLTLIAPEDSRIHSAGVGGSMRAVGDASGKFTLACTGRSCDGMELMIVQGRAEPTTFTLVGARSGLPQSAAPLLANRPRDAQPQYAPDQTLAFTRIKV